MFTIHRLFASLLAGLIMPPIAAAIEPQPTITLLVDASQAPRRLFHSKLHIPAQPGSLTLVYPKWTPGDHAPDGPITDVTNLRISSGGQPITWRRDLEDMFAVTCEVPSGSTGIDVEFDFLSVAGTDNPTAFPTATAQLAVIDWHMLLMYPVGKPSNEQTFAPSLQVPQGWKTGGALEVAATNGKTIEYKPTSLEMLVDHPVVTGAHYRDINLTPGEKPEHHIDIVAEADRDLDISAEHVVEYAHLVDEMAKLFGSRHYQSYHFLVSLTDKLNHFGLEHHECSDNRLTERAFLDEDIFRDRAASLLTHEWFHSWNGKHRRPAGLATSDFQKPMHTDLLWVYEGLTEYYGDVLAPRCGAWTPEVYREYLAFIAAKLDARPGRSWRPLQDTADAAQILYFARTDWQGERRETDFYDEGGLIWLEADALIRRKTEGGKSLDDFCRLFHGQSANGLAGEPPTVKTYTDEDVFATLGQICPNDWKGFFTQRLTRTGGPAPMGGITACGWRLVYSDEVNTFDKGDGKYPSLFHTLGLLLDDDAKVTDVLRGTPAFTAGLGPGMKIVAVNGRKISPDVLGDVIKASTASPNPIELLVENSDFFSTMSVNYHGGERWPHLKPIEGAADLLSLILAPRAR